MKSDFYSNLKENFTKGNFAPSFYKSFFDRCLEDIGCKKQNCEKLFQFKNSINFLLKKYSKLNFLKNKNEEVFYQVLHDIKSPASGIKFALEGRLADEFSLEIYKTNMNILNLVHSFLTFYSFKTGKTLAKSGLVDINEIVEAQIDELKYLIKNKNIKLFYDKTASCKLFCQKIILNRIILNLISNALEHTENGSCVYISTGFDKDFCTFKISNDFALKNKASFKKFFKKFNTKTPESSYGLGLLICKRLALIINSKLSAKLDAGKIVFDLKIPKA